MLQLIDVTRRFVPRTALDRVRFPPDKPGFDFVNHASPKRGIQRLLAALQPVIA